VRIKNITRAAMAAGLVVAAVGIGSPDAGADLNGTDPGNQLVQCTSSELIASLNPTIKDGNATDFFARYVKATSKRSDGTKTFLTNPIPADSTTCSVDAGIRTNQGAQDVKYVLDDQSNGNATLTLASVAAALTGSTQCNSNSVNVPGVNDYPTSYPLQGKLIYKFVETFPTLAPIQIQMFIRTYTDATDTAGLVHVTGTVIKGPGVGGRITTAFTFLPTDSAKNSNVVAGCPDGTPGNAYAGELWITGGDSVYDADVANETVQITISDDFASENQ
jgi:hypothetical protein